MFPWSPGLRETNPPCLSGVDLVLAVSVKLYRTQGDATPLCLATTGPGTPESAWNPHGPNMVHPLPVPQYLPSCSHVGTHPGPASLPLDLVWAQRYISQEPFRTSSLGLEPGHHGVFLMMPGDS